MLTAFCLFSNLFRILTKSAIMLFNRIPNLANFGSQRKQFAPSGRVDAGFVEREVDLAELGVLEFRDCAELFHLEEPFVVFASCVRTLLNTVHHVLHRVRKDRVNDRLERRFYQLLPLGRGRADDVREVLEPVADVDDRVILDRSLARCVCSPPPL